MNVISEDDVKEDFSFLSWDTIRYNVLVEKYGTKWSFLTDQSQTQRHLYVQGKGDGKWLAGIDSDTNRLTEGEKSFACKEIGFSENICFMATMLK